MGALSIHSFEFITKANYNLIMALFILAIAPGIAICFYILIKDKYNKEPKRFLIVSFILGVLSAIPAVVLESIFGINTGFENSILAAAYMAYPVVALAEEGSKFFVLRRYAYPKSEFDEPFDGIVYSVMIGMGFATIENIGYVMQFGFVVGIVRMLLSVPAHATFAVIMGYYMGEAKFAPDRGQARKLILKGLLYAVLFHGTFDFFLFLREHHLVKDSFSSVLLFFGAVSSFIVAIILSRKAIREHVELSKSMHEG